ncbi:MAG: DNA N-6-adenine-methyltransferase [Candidatus Omnitrophica bacterium]|jgi:site-specific DNA-methyltransferase (adenine-specific)|nr:DNA N-6-adenine-methyltransferase [Candidatus Omnitrophota bacterium]
MKKSKMSKGLFTSNSDSWETPQYFFDKLNEEFNFDVDVCATPENAKCRRFITKEQNGLSLSWEMYCALVRVSGGRVWMNPPYGREIGKWVKKAYEEGRKSGITVVGLLPARTDTKWFHDYIYGKAEIRFIKGRLRFVDGKNSAPFPSMVVIWGGKRPEQPL